MEKLCGVEIGFFQTFFFKLFEKNIMITDVRSIGPRLESGIFCTGRRDVSQSRIQYTQDNGYNDQESVVRVFHKSTDE